MAHRQKHRGQHAQDEQLFSEKSLSVINEAIEDLSYLLSKGYADASALALVGNHFLLQKRQRKALLRASCPDASRKYRLQHQLSPAALRDQTLAVDGYNLLITVESMIAGGLILRCRDGCLRDIASIHGTYRRVEETLPALTLIGQCLESLKVQQVNWYLDAPVSNSGRLKSLMLQWAATQGFPWEVFLVNSPDKTLVALDDQIVVSSDSWVLDHCLRWFNLPEELLPALPEAWVVNLMGQP